MALEIPAALIGGALNGLVVFGGIFAENRLERSRGRALAIEAATLELNDIIGTVAVGFTLQEVDRGENSPWFRAQGRAIALTHEIRLMARGRKHRATALEAERLSAKLGACVRLVIWEGVLLPKTVLLELSTRDLVCHVFGEVKSVQEQSEDYMARWRP